MKKPSLKTQAKLCVAFVWIGALISVSSQMFGSWLLWAGIAVTGIAAICRATLIRCPHCHHALPDGQRIPPRCPHCGGELN